MTVENAPSTRPLLTIRPAAIAHIKGLLARQNTPEHFLRVAVSGGGCSGMSYKLAMEPESKPTDKVLNFEGLKVLVDPKSSLYLAGIEIDYSDDLMNAGFQYINPNAKTTCGCGTSFSA